MKNIMVLSDTHMPRHGKTIPKKILHYMDDIDMIIHAGDFQTYEFYELFKQYKDIIAVYGNNDDQKLKTLLPKKSIFKIDEIKIGLFHGHGQCLGINKNMNSLNRTKNTFKNDEVDLIVFGHSHIPFIQKEEHVTLFNPGSPTNKRLQKEFSFGILTIEGNKFEFKHIFFKDKN